MSRNLRSLKGPGFKSMFEHEHHNKILRILNSLNPAIFNEVGAYFGGGTLITLLYGEYRWSKDVDFLCPIGPGYRRLRQIVAESNSKPEIFFSNHSALKFPRDLTADQYGIRFLVMSDDTPIKFEIVAEARISLEPPESPQWLNVPCLSMIDRYAEKLLANADRWADASVESRDLIDLAVLRLNEELPEVAVVKAEQAYPVLPSLIKSLTEFKLSKEKRNKCFSKLQIRDRAMIIDGIDMLASDFNLAKTIREDDEINYSDFY